MEPVSLVDAVVIGAGQAGLSASWHLRRRGVAHVLLDADDAPGGAWRHRWPGLVMGSVNGVHDLPGSHLPDADPAAPAAEVVPAYFAEYERRWDLPVRRPVPVRAVCQAVTCGDDPPDGDMSDRLFVHAGSPDGRSWAARVVLNATGTWTRPFWPHYPGRQSFAGLQLHTATYRGAAELSGRSVVVIGGGISAVQLLLEVDAVAHTTWVTRAPPAFIDEPFDEAAGRAAVARVEQRVRAGLPPGSVVSVTGLPWTPALREAAARGVLDRYPVMDRVVPRGIAWDAPVGPGGAHGVDADVLLWCTGFRSALDHLAPLRLREPGGGIRVEGTRAVRERRLHLLGYGPSASTIGANRAGRDAVSQVVELLCRDH